MKKFGFTLAEVLITLAIIGVVAVLTLPALMNNVGEQQYITGFKKGINTLTASSQIAEAQEGYSYDTISNTSALTSPDDLKSVYGLLNNRIAIDQNATNKQGEAPFNEAVGTGNFVIYLKDQTSLIFPAAPADGYNDVAADGHIAGIKAIYDTNGRKGPNQVSHCNIGMTFPEGTPEENQVITDAHNNTANCNEKTKRFIKDRFSILLRGNYPEPNGDAARWALSK